MSNSEIQDIRQKIEDLKRKVDSVNNSSDSKAGEGPGKGPESEVGNNLSLKKLRKLGAAILLAALTALAGTDQTLQAKESANKTIPPDKNYITTDDPSDADSLKYSLENLKAHENNQQAEFALHDSNPSKDTEPVLKVITLPENSGQFKSYMDYQTVTDKTSRQYNLLQSPNITINEQGLCCYRLDGVDYPLVAVGSGVEAQIGQRLDVSIQNPETGEVVVIKVIISDSKKDEHTDPTNLIHSDGSVIEFLVDTKKLIELQSLAAKMGNLSYLQFNLATLKPLEWLETNSIQATPNSTEPFYPLTGYVIEIQAIDKIVNC